MQQGPLLCGAMALSAAACAAPSAVPAATESPAVSEQPVQPSEQPAGGKFLPGEYEGEASGNNGPIQVRVSVDENNILSVEVTKNVETAGIADAALELMPASIVEAQSLAVDTVAGATNTSKGIVAAVENALLGAGATAEALYVPIEKVAGEDMELTADVVIVGGGGSGVAAAAAAGEAGASVIVLEETASLGGNTKASGGGLNVAYAAQQSQQEMIGSMDTVYAICAEEPQNELHKQLQEQVKEDADAYVASGATYQFDTPEFHALQTYKGGDYAGDLALILALCQNAPDTVDWLKGYGMGFKEKMIMLAGALWPRGLETVEPRGSGYINVLSAAARDQYGVQFLMNTAGKELIVESGAVVGVKGIMDDGTNVTVRANKGVILATGGFSANREMVKQYIPNLPDSVGTSNSPAAKGDGIRMATAIGAQTVGMEHIQLLPLGDPTDGSTNGWLSGAASYMVYINKEGKRFVAEDERRDVMCNALFEQTGGFMWTIQDAANDRISGREALVEQLIKDGKIVTADTFEELAVQMDIDPEVLAETMEKFNHAAETGVDEEFGRTVFSGPINTPPYYASKRVPTVHHTMGGLKIDEQCHVYNTEGEVIEGLFAAGEVTGGIHGTNRLGGNAVADTQVFGRIAGRTAASAE